MVKRYKFTSSEFASFVLEDDGGDLVLFTDYDSLERERDGLREALNKLMTAMENAGWDCISDEMDEAIELAKGADHELSS